MLSAVIGHGRAIFGDGNDNLVGDGVDFQNAVHDIERDVREVLIRVLEVARDDANRVFARVLALRRPRGGFGRLDALGHVVQRVVSRHGLVALDAVLIAVVGHDGAVLGDGDGNLVGHRGDRHIAVDHLLDGHVVVGAGDGEGVLGQTHVRRANVRAPGDGEYIGLEADRNLTRLAGEAVVIAIRLVLLAVVYRRFIGARDGDGGRSLVDGQRAVLAFYIIIGRNRAARTRLARVHDMKLVDHVRLLARVRDGGLLRHGHEEVFLRVAIDQTFDCEIGLGQRRAVVDLIRALGGDGQRHSVIDPDDVFGFVSLDRDCLRGSIADHGVLFVKRCAPVRRNLRADGHRAGFVFGNLDGGAVQVMMDGVARGVELEVQLQHQRTVAGDIAGKHVVLVIRFEHVLVVFLSRLIGFGHGNGRVRGGRALVAVVERVSATDVLIVELDGVLGVGVRRPDGVEDVVAAVVHLHRVARFDGAFALGVGVPALEGVADAGEGSAGSGGDGRVVSEVFNLVRAHAAIGFVGQGCASGTSAPLGDEGDDVLFIGVIALDLVLIAGLVGGRAVIPAEEVLAIGSNQLARGHKVSKAVLRVGLAILRSGYVVLAGNIFYSEGAVLGVVGIQDNTGINLGVGIEGLTSAVRAGAPAAPSIASTNLCHDFCLLGIQCFLNCVALFNLDFKGRIHTFNGQINRTIKDRWIPLGVNGHVLRGHGLAGEVIGLCCCFISIPTAKDIILLADGLDRGRIASRVRNALFELLGSGVYRLTAAHVDDVIAVAVIVELGAVIVCAVLRTLRGVAGEAGNGITVFLGNRRTAASASIRMIQHILAIQVFKIIVRFCTALIGLKKLRTIQRHSIDIGLECRSTRRSIPYSSRPFVFNILFIFGSDSLLSNFLIFFISRKPRRTGVFHCPEGHVIHIALVVHAHDRRAVARDGLLRNGLRGEAGIALLRRVGLCAGGAGLGFGFRIGILIVIGVFQPVDDGVARIGIGRPDGVERQRLIERLPEGERRAAHGCRPVVERIAGAGGGGGRGGRAVALYERGLDIGAALRIKGDPVTIRDNSRKCDVFVFQLDGGNDIAAFILPTDDGLLIADRIGHAIGGDGIAVLALLRDHDFTLLIGEEHEVHVREAGVDGDGRRGAADGRGDGEGKLVSTFVKPADEFLVRAVRGRRAGIVERLAVLQNLASEFLRAIHEDVRRRRNRRLHDAFQRNAGAGLRAAGDGHDGRQRVHGRAADEHDKRHQQGKTPTKLVFHKKLILPMKFS